MSLYVYMYIYIYCSVCDISSSPHSSPTELVHPIPISSPIGMSAASNNNAENTGLEDGSVRKPLLLRGDSLFNSSRDPHGKYASGGSSPPLLRELHAAIDFNGDPSVILLETTGLMWNGTAANVLQRIRLTRQSLSWYMGEKSTHIAVEDIVGALRRGDNELIIHSYPREIGCCSSSAKAGADRIHVQTRLQLGTGSVDLMDTWANMLNALLVQPWLASSNVDPSKGDVIRPRRLMFFVNPVGGAGNAWRNWLKIQPIIQHSGVPYTVLKTTHANHAWEVVNALSPNSLDSPTDLVCISGDGLVHEVLNGILQRGDRLNAARQFRLGHIGGGSGNGLSSTICAGAMEPMTIFASAFLVAKGFSRPMDVFALKQAEERVRFGFLSICYGFVSDVDLESESMRYLGNARFTVAGLKKLWSMNRYQARLEYISADEEVNKSLPLDAADKVAAKSSGIDNAVSVKCGTAENGCDLCGHIGGHGQRAHQHDGRDALEKFLANQPMEGAAAAAAGGADIAAASAAVAAADAAPSIPADDGVIPAPSIPASPWCRVEDGFTLIWMMNVTHAASDMHVAPTAHYSDGVMEIYTVQYMPRAGMLSLLFSMENGSHMNNPDIHRIRAKSIRITPLDARISQLTTDGERLPYKPLEAHSFRGVINLLAK
jgi:diacylglycerol kinase family enzyme